MGQCQPFLLDHGYRGKLDSDAWRQHFLRRHNKDEESERVMNVFNVAFPGGLLVVGAVLLSLGFYFNAHQPEVFYVLGGISTGFGLIIGLIMLCVTPGDRAEKRAFRKWAADLTLVEGELTDCTGELIKGAEDDSFYVKAHFRAVAPNGKEVTGWIRHLRDDLHQQPLPAAGTTVLVMTTPDGSWSGML